MKRVVVGAILIIIAGSAQAQTTYKPTPLSTPETVVSGLSQATADAPMRIAERRGYFTAEGIVLKTERLNPGEVLAPIATGQVDTAIMAAQPGFFNALARGIAIQVVASGGLLTRGHDNAGLTVRADHIETGRYKGPADLKGMKIGIYSLYSPMGYMLKLLLDKHGLTLNDIDVVVLPALAQSLVALKTKGIDALATFEPFLTMSKADNSAQVVLRSLDVLPDLSPPMIVFSSVFVEKRPEAAERYLTAWLRGARDYIAEIDRPETRPGMIALLRDAGIQMLETAEISTFDPDGRYKGVKSMKDMLAWYRHVGQVQADIDVDKIVNTTLIERAARRLQ